MNEEEEEVMRKSGWIIESYSPFEVRHKDGSFASGQAAFIVTAHVMKDWYCEEDE